MSSRYRGLYLRALAPEGPLSLGADDLRHVRTALAADDGDTGDDGPELPSLIEEAGRWSAQENARFRTVLATPAPGPAEPEQQEILRRILRNCAPLALSAGAWLQWIPAPGNSETEPVLTVLSLYASDVGAGRPLADRGSEYRALLRGHGIVEETPGVRLASSEYVEGFSFRLPALLLAMSRRPVAFLPEILGADLCLRTVGLIPPLAAALGAGDYEGVDPAALDLGGARPGTAASGRELSLAATRAYLEDRHALEGPAGGEAATRRLLGGFRWAQREIRVWSERLRHEVVLSQHPDYGVWRLIHARARQAAVYHSRFKLAGRPLSEWFADVDAGPRPFLRALAKSPLVRPGKPDASPLLGRLIGPKGPMFRIFTEEEIATLHRWIALLPEPGSVLHPLPGTDSVTHQDLHGAQESWHTQGSDLAAESARAAPLPPAPPRLLTTAAARTAYRALLGREDSAELRAFAHAYATRWLARSRYAMDRAPEQLPARWDPENGLREWLARAHDRHAESFQRGEAALPTRAELIDSTLQLAPLIMIDGGWLQGFTDYQHASSRSGHFLFRTYWDELGNGEPELNHPRIYRALLRDMGIDLPPTASREFSAWTGFRDESFAMPAFWLSVSRFPETFMPEILGLNLAMELSGVGGSYRDARVALRHHGFSTQFVDLHNTIDNVATGHSAWAADAIDAYLADLPAVLGPGQQDAVWDRIRVGHRSLNPPGGTAAELYATLRGRRAHRTRRPTRTSRI
ncbi:iron-containing redox enzyme family protein [Streptomyces sp. BPTC-684]|uniref:iron-containing redox enzyme family protein n=1 Tax=Streptomyces sp. BPTC-684 TaxID=3043734 RepID=UPI0024B0BB30|nr:iron-containing redox enzyme family protein [Streptomyces sp. BPTC-684]WHM40038.1 iron-containing redox enzyme family protein [Streptomyces sp. BPTC-684]